MRFKEKMMDSMKDHSHMMHMMGGMKDAKGREFKPWEMCEKMMSSMMQSTDIAAFATPEIRELFKEWAGQIEEEILVYLKENRAADIDSIAENFKISKRSVIYFLSDLALKERVSLKVEKTL
jgi:hypothetical protein